MRKPFKCPICGGKGVANALDVSLKEVECNVCQGRKILWSPPRHDPSWFDFITNLGQLVFWATFLFWIIWVWS